MPARFARTSDRLGPACGSGPLVQRPVLDVADAIPRVTANSRRSGTGTCLPPLVERLDRQVEVPGEFLDPDKRRKTTDVLEHRALAQAEPAEALAAPGDAADTAVPEVPEPLPEAKAVKVPVAGSIVTHFGKRMAAQVLAPDCHRGSGGVRSGRQ